MLRTQTLSTLLVLSSWLPSYPITQGFCFPLLHLNYSQQEGKVKGKKGLLFHSRNNLEVVHISSASISQDLKTSNGENLVFN